MDTNSRVVSVASHSLETKVKSKKDLYTLLSEHCNFHLMFRPVLPASIRLLSNQILEECDDGQEEGNRSH